MKKFLIASGVAVLAFATMASAQGATFNTNLTVGSTGADVVALQTWLIANGYSIPAVQSGAAAKGYFGAQTQAAVKAFQLAKGLPSTGFFGPLTRGLLNGGTTGSPVVSGPVTCPAGYSCVPVGGGAPVTTVGVEGQLNSFDLLGSVSSETVDENESNAKVLGVEFDAEDSSMTIDRVDVDFTAPNTGSDNLDDYIDSVSLWLGSTKLGTLSVNDADDDTNDLFSFRFSGLKGVVSKDTTANLYVAVDAVNNVDSNDSGSWTVEIPENGIRATDSAGISDTYVGASDDLSETFTVGDANSGELDVTENNDSPVAGITTVSEDNDTSDVTLMIIDLEADEAGITVDQLPVGLVASGADVDMIVKTLKLVRGSTVLDSKSIPSSAGTSYRVVFDDLNLDIDDGDTETLKIVADINDLEGTDFVEGDSVYATTTGSDSNWDVEDTNNDSVTPDGDVTGEARSFYKDGIAVALVGSPTADSVDGLATFTINFSVKANGSDAYISDNAPDAILAAATPSGTNVGLQYSTSTTAGVAYVQSTDLAGTINSGDVSGSYFKVNKGQTRTFSLVVEASNTSTSTYASSAIALRSINWSTTTAAASFINHYTFDLGAFLTPTETWRTAP